MRTASRAARVRGPGTRPRSSTGSHTPEAREKGSDAFSWESPVPSRQLSHFLDGIPALPWLAIRLQSTAMKRLALILSLAAGLGFAAAPEEFSTSAGPLRLTPIQHASLMIQAGGKGGDRKRVVLG